MDPLPVLGIECPKRACIAEPAQTLSRASRRQVVRYGAIWDFPEIRSTLFGRSP